ncbi:hypothetical protein [Streptomyces sp. NBC_00887]|uniref:hypothetical protein n=1 Tax=Streptomyces sp. NBC_00887 TaxID=2975859 RepID=UPI00386CD74E|nr:hypothetical protein OG844_01105 [Streptomyces sp. NBC_00887]WSY36231.1 hypothetical protein OG844_44490 [Streptomyces sp. NBC_00887]
MREPREASTGDLAAAYFCSGVVIVASVTVGMLVDPLVAALVAGPFAALFFIGLVVTHFHHKRGMDAVRQAYVATFVWTKWF